MAWHLIYFICEADLVVMRALWAMLPPRCRRSPSPPCLCLQLRPCHRRCGFLPVWRHLPFLVFLQTLLFTGCAYFLPPGSCPCSSAHAQLPACNTRTVKEMSLHLSDLYSWLQALHHWFPNNTVLPSCPQEEAADAAQWNEILVSRSLCPGVNDGEHCWTTQHWAKYTDTFHRYQYCLVPLKTRACFWRQHLLRGQWDCPLIVSPASKFRGVTEMTSDPASQTQEDSSRRCWSLRLQGASLRVAASRLL